MRRIVIAFVLLTGAAYSEADNSRWVAGTNYTVLAPARPTAAAPGHVEVVEVFSYTCGHCYLFEPRLRQWLKEKPDHVQFTRLPTSWSPKGRALARLHYTVTELGRADIESRIFEAVYRDRIPLFARDAGETYARQLRFVESFGVLAADFAKTYNSAAVAAKMRRADELILGYRVESTPTLVINGTYTITPQQAQGAAKGSEDFAPLLSVANELIAREHRAKAASNAKRAP